MANKKRITDLEIARKIKAGNDFTVDNISQRNRAYTISNALEKTITVRPSGSGFKISFI